jgi:diketogulonate reductase-like aldo/keto reductase
LARRPWPPDRVQEQLEHGAGGENEEEPEEAPVLLTMLRRRDLKESVMTAAGMRPGSAPGGFASLPKATDNATVLGIAAELGVTPAQVGLAWQLAHYDRTLLIPGTSSPVHLAENLAVGTVTLPAAALAALDQLAAPGA